jgi:hypothetical protein
MSAQSYLIRRGYALLTFGMSFFSCGGDRADEPDITTYRDTGALCLQPESEGQARITIRFGNCLSCNQVATSSCSATVAGTQINLQSTLDVESKNTPELCPGGCDFAVATCALTVPPPGQYGISHGADSATVTLPLPSALAPFGGDACDP